MPAGACGSCCRSSASRESRDEACRKSRKSRKRRKRGSTMSGRSHREGPGDRAHRQVGELLPWYVNGTLGERERGKVEDHLAGCPACQAEERACRRMAEAALAAAEVSPSPHPAQLGRLLDRIEVEERARGGRLASLRSQFGAAPRPLRVALL